VPVTYPPKKVNGFVIPGLLTHNKAKRKSFPADLIDEIRKIAPGFKFSPKEWTRGYKPGLWVNELIEDIKTKVKVTAHLMKNKDWDLLMVHFMETDQVQHFMWHYLEKEKGWNPVLEIYQEIDQAIGSLRENLTTDDTLFIMSDHGFGPLNYNFHIDTWLLNEGYIKLRKNLATRLKKLGFSLGITKETLYPLGEYLYPLCRRTGWLETVLDVVGNPVLDFLFLSSHNVDWGNSQAYSHSEIGHIYLNIKGREPEGAVEPGFADKVREELVEKLLKLQNPYTGKKITSQVMKGEEIYQGKYRDQAPDIVFLPDDMEILGKGAYEFLSHRVVSRSRSQSGHHRMDGIFLGTGPGIKTNYRVEGAHIMDIAPTVLYTMELPLFNHMDGSVLDSIFTEEALKINSPKYIDKEEIGFEPEGEEIDIGEDEDDDDEMKDRLEGLGYLS